jgi:hypothetical protein
VVLFGRLCLVVFVAGRRHLSLEAEMLSELVDDIVVQRAGMRELLGNAEFREHVEYFFRLHLELPRQLINSNLLHKGGLLLG